LKFWQNNRIAAPVPTPDEIIKYHQNPTNIGTLQIYGNLKNMFIRTIGGWQVEIEEGNQQYLLKIV